MSKNYEIMSEKFLTRDVLKIGTFHLFHNYARTAVIRFPARGTWDSCGRKARIRCRGGRRISLTNLFEDFEAIFAQLW